MIVNSYGILSDGYQIKSAAKANFQSSSGLGDSGRRQFFSFRES